MITPTMVYAEYAEFGVAAVALLVYLGTYIVQGRGEWYRNVFGWGQVLLCVVALAWYSKVFFNPLHRASRSNLVFYGLIMIVFCVMAAGGVWIASGRAGRRRRRRAEEFDDSPST